MTNIRKSLASVLFASFVAVPAALADDARDITTLNQTLYHTTPDGIVDEFQPSLLGLPPDQQAAFLAPELAGALGSDPADRDRISTCVGYGPLVNGQDWKIEHFDIEQPIVQGHRAATRATFHNMGRPTSIEFRLRRTPQGWRITELGDLNKALEECQ